MQVLYKESATPLDMGRRRPVAKRRFQKGCFVKEGSRMYSMFYVDAGGGSKRVKQYIGKLQPDVGARCTAGTRPDYGRREPQTRQRGAGIQRTDLR